MAQLFHRQATNTIITCRTCCITSQDAKASLSRNPWVQGDLVMSGGKQGLQDCLYQTRLLTVLQTQKRTRLGGKARTNLRTEEKVDGLPRPGLFLQPPGVQSMRGVPSSNLDY